MTAAEGVAWTGFALFTVASLFFLALKFFLLFKHPEEGFKEWRLVLVLGMVLAAWPNFLSIADAAGMSFGDGPIIFNHFFLWLWIATLHGIYFIVSTHNNKPASHYVFSIILTLTWTSCGISTAFAPEEADNTFWGFLIIGIFLTILSGAVLVLPIKTIEAEQRRKFIVTLGFTFITWGFYWSYVFMGIQGLNWLNAGWNMTFVVIIDLLATAGFGLLVLFFPPDSLLSVIRGQINNSHFETIH